MTRPDFGQMGGLVLKDIQRTASGGNANLKPIRSNNLDVGAEWYFAPKSMVSAGVYLMKMGSYVTFGETTRTFYNFAEKKDTVYTMSAPINTTAEVKGLELNYIQALAGGFGVNANYTYANGKETSAAPKSACAMTGNCDMVGTSKNTYNLGTYFENDDFSARVNYSYRSTFLNGIDRKSAIYQAGVGSLSVSFAYNINKNLAVTLEGKDLNNPMLKSYAASEDQPRAFYKNGRQVYLGLRAKM
jgi:iron complex outermembrane receptor protein